LLSLFLGTAILYSKPANKGDYGSTPNDASVKVATENKPTSINAYKNEISRSEVIKVNNNNSEIDLHARLIEDKSGQVSLNLEYKVNGKPVSKKIDTSGLAEIRNIFRFRERNKNGYRLNNMILNEKMNKLYFSIEGKKDKNYTKTSVYSYGLVSSKIDKIICDSGEFSKFEISPDGKYNAFSYLNCPQNLNRNKKNIVIVVKCSDNKIILNSGSDIKQQDNNSGIYVYSYDFVKWNNNHICELIQRTKAKDNLQQTTEQTVYYDVTTNTLSNEIN
jgi:hypothetical protein